MGSSLITQQGNPGDSIVAPGDPNDTSYYRGVVPPQLAGTPYSLPKTDTDVFSGGSFTKPGTPQTVQLAPRTGGGDQTVAKQIDYDEEASRYVNRVMTLEGSGKDPRSSAVGGFIDSTWLSLMRQAYPETAQMPPQQVLAMRSDPKLRAQMTALYAKDNAGIIQQAGYQPDATSLRLAHWFGPEGATRVLGSDPSMPMERIFSPEVIAANPILAGKTAGQVISLTSQQMAGTDMRTLWNAVSPEEQEALGRLRANADSTAGALRRKFDEYARIANSAPPGSKERDDAIAEMRANSHEMMQTYRQMMMHPPVQKPIDAWENFGSIGTIVGLLGGLFAHQHMTAALNAAGTAMEAINTNNSEQYERAYKTWERQADMGLKMIEMENQDIRSLIDDKKMSIDEKQTRLATLATEMGLIKTIGDVQNAPLEKMADILEKRATAAGQMKNQIDAVKLQTYNTVLAADLAKNVPYEEASRHAMEVSGITRPPPAAADRAREVDSVVKAADEQYAKDHPDATEVEKKAAHYQNYLDATQKMSDATSRPRSPGAAIMDQIRKENPGAPAERISQIYTDVYVRPQAIERAFGSGISARNLQALNTVADHINSLKQIADAFKTGDVVRANALVQRIATETGHPEITNFNTARDFLAGETVRLMTATGGSETDRRNMESHFNAAGSPEQIYGALNVARDFVRGRLNALEQTYARNDPTRRKEFETEMLTEGARTLFGPEGAISPPSAESSGAAGGTIKYDAQGNRVQ